jgi:hypothetical protein
MLQERFPSSINAHFPLILVGFASSLAKTWLSVERTIHQEFPRARFFVVLSSKTSVKFCPTRVVSTFLGSNFLFLKLAEEKLPFYTPYLLVGACKTTRVYELQRKVNFLFPKASTLVRAKFFALILQCYTSQKILRALLFCVLTWIWTKN